MRNNTSESAHASLKLNDRHTHEFANKGDIGRVHFLPDVHMANFRARMLPDAQLMKYQRLHVFAVPNPI